jgi:CBS domain containing-hemolysin-like protein
MELTVWIKLLVLAALLGCYSFFAVAETSLFSLSPLARLKLKNKGDKKGRLIDGLLAHPNRLLISIIIGNEGVIILATILATSLALNFWGPQGKWLALLVMAPALLLFGEIIPKSIALTYPERMAALVVGPLTALMPLLTPIRAVLLAINRGLLGFLGFPLETPAPLVQEDDFLRMVEDSHQGGMIAPIEREFIVNLMAFDDTTVAQVMVPPPDIFSLSIHKKSTELIAAIKRARFSRVPIYGDNLEDILGILHARDLLNVPRGHENDSTFLKNLLRAPYYVPKNKRAFDLLGELQARKLRLALVVDEYGSLAGLVTLEDILEELFGEIEEEFQQAPQPLVQLAPGVYQVKSRMPLEEFNEILGRQLPWEDFDTLGGFVLNLFGELPREGDVVTYEGLRFEVLRMKGTRIIELLISLEAP